MWRWWPKTFGIAIYKKDCYPKNKECLHLVWVWYWLPFCSTVRIEVLNWVQNRYIVHMVRPLDYSINSYWINYWISFLVIFILLNKNFKKLFLFLMNKILGYLTIYSIILFFIIQLISLKIFRARSAREWIFIKRKKKFPKKTNFGIGYSPLKIEFTPPLAKF